MPERIEFQSKGLTVLGHLYVPPAGAPDRKRAGIVVGHPMGGVKEQTAGLHAKLLADAGFVTLTWDAAYQGESAGEPRGLEDPAQRAEDVRSAVSYLSTRPEVDATRIGGLGICASGGYVPFAAQTDLRIKAVATVSAADTGSFFRDGMKNTAFEMDRAALDKTLEASSAARTAEANGEPVAMQPLVPDSPEGLPDSIPTMLREGAEYYRTPRAQHPRSTNRYPTRSIALLVNYDSYAFNYLISPRPLLMIAGSNADTLYFSQEGIERAKEPKELYLVPGMSHIALYDNVHGHLPKLVDFMSTSLCA
ncbi:alpha/beta-hydrolase [Aspergillus californicus]